MHTESAQCRGIIVLPTAPSELFKLDFQLCCNFQNIQDSSKTPCSRHPHKATVQEKALSLCLSITQAEHKHPSGKGWGVWEEKAPHRKHANKVALGPMGTTW